jgi:hypothetical protein
MPREPPSRGLEALIEVFGGNRMGQGQGFKELAAISESLTFQKFHLLRRLTIEVTSRR